MVSSSGKPELLLIRGLPGEGKTTLANALPGHVSVSADQFNEDMVPLTSTLIEIQYHYDPNFVSDSHDWCQAETLRNLRMGRSVAVHNTFLALWEFKPYVAMAERLGIGPVLVFEMPPVPREVRLARNLHGIDDATYDRMESKRVNLGNVLEEFDDQLRAVSYCEVYERMTESILRRPALEASDDLGAWEQRAKRLYENEMANVVERNPTYKHRRMTLEPSGTVTDEGTCDG